MNYTLAIFRTRFATLNFANLLRASNIPVAIINTPPSLGSVCGISVKFLSDYFSKVQTLLTNRTILGNFVGFYAFSERDGRLFKL